MNYKSFPEHYLAFGDVIGSMLATIASQDLLKISKNTKAALTKKRAASNWVHPVKVQVLSSRCSL